MKLVMKSIKVVLFVIGLEQRSDFLFTSGLWNSLRLRKDLGSMLWEERSRTLRYTSPGLSQEE